MTSPRVRSLACAGPLPPPVGGATETFRSLLQLLADEVDHLVAYNLSPLRFSRFGRARVVLLAGTLSRAVLGARRTDQPCLVYMSATRLTTTAVPLRMLATRKRLFLGFFGSDVGEVLHGLPPRRAARLANFLRTLGGVFVETELAQRELLDLQVPSLVVGPIRLPGSLGGVPEAAGPLLVYAGRVTPEKGVAQLMSAVKEQTFWSLEIAGPVAPGFDQSFERLLAAAGKRVRYVGVLGPLEARELLARGAFSVLLSSYSGEGAAGSVVESLQVGTPAIVSRHRALPELVTHMQHGLVAGQWGSPDDVASVLVEARAVYESPAYASMRTAARVAGDTYDGRRALTTLLEVISAGECA